MNLTLDLPLCQECQEEIKRSNICILGTKTREIMMNDSRISGAVVVATSSLTIWGS